MQIIRESQYTSVQFSRPVVSDSLRPHGLQHVRLPCLSPSPEAYSNSCPLSQRCHPAISSSTFPFSFCLQSFPASGSFKVRQFITSGSKNIGVSASASILPIQEISTGLTSLQSMGLSRVSSNTSSKASILWHSAFFTHRLCTNFPSFCKLKTLLKEQCLLKRYI